MNSLEMLTESLLAAKDFGASMGALAIIHIKDIGEGRSEFKMDVVEGDTCTEEEKTMASMILGFVQTHLQAAQRIGEERDGNTTIH